MYRLVSIKRLPRREGCRIPYSIAVLLLSWHRIEWLYAKKEVADLFRDLIAARAYGGTNASENIAWMASKLFAHRIYRCQHDSTRSAAPPAMRDTNNLLYGVVEHNRHAIRERERERDATLIRNQRVPLMYLLRRPGAVIIGAMRPIGAPVIANIGNMRIGPMYVPKRDTRIVIKFKAMQGEFAILDNRIEIVTPTQCPQCVETSIRWKAVAPLSREDTMNDIRKLAYGVELEMTGSFLLLCNQNVDPS